MEMLWPLEPEIKWAALNKLMDEPNFETHKETVKKHGFVLHIKRAKIGTSKHIRVRPMFPQWAIRGEIAVIDDQITKQILQDILTYSGRYKGLGDWRPGGKTPGSHGMFTARVI